MEIIYRKQLEALLDTLKHTKARLEIFNHSTNEIRAQITLTEQVLSGMNIFLDEEASV